MTLLRVLVVCRDRLSRAGLAAVLDQQSGITVVGQVVGDDNSLLPLDTYVPDVIVWDVSWETSNAVNSLGLLPESAPPVLGPWLSQVIGPPKPGQRAPRRS